MNEDALPDWKVRGIRANERRHSEAKNRIIEAVNDLENEGKPLSVRAVRAKAGSGSFSTICRFLRLNR